MNYYVLAKPGLVYGNLITVIAGFAMGAAVMHGFGFAALFAVIIGMAFVMGSGCIFNNVIDRRLDAAMARTKNRAIAAGRISPRAALAYGICLGAAGFILLALFTNWLTFAAAGVGWFVYVVLYSLWAKRRTVHGALIGSIAGAVPPVAGYAAASGQLDLGAGLLFIILVLWQMPHFYAIGIYRADDYAAGGVPVLPVRRGIAATKRAMFGYIIAFIFIAPLIAVFGYAGRLYFSVAVVLGLIWLLICVRGFRWDGEGDTDTAADKQWARKMFFFSLAVMTTLFIVLTADSLLKIY